MQNMNSYPSNLTVGHYSKNYGVPFQQLQPIGNPAPVNNNFFDVVKLLSVLFQGKVCIYTDKLKNKQRLLSQAEAEVYVGNYYPIMLFAPFDSNGHLYDYISIEYITKWFEAEDGFSKFEFRYPINDQEKDEAIKNIIAQTIYFNNITVTGSFPSTSAAGTFSGPISTTNATVGQPTI